MDERFEISILMDFYSNLLTEKQRDIMNMYYNEDLSLGEIAELNNTSRQAIYDIIKRCQKLLLDYENKLELKKKDDILRNVKQSINDVCNNIKKKTTDYEVLSYIREIEKYIMENL